MTSRKILLSVLVLSLILINGSLVSGESLTSLVDYKNDYAYGYGKAPYRKQGIQKAKEAAIDIARSKLLEEVYFSKLRTKFVWITNFRMKEKDWEIQGLVRVDQITIRKMKQEKIIEARVRIPIENKMQLS